MPIDPGDHSQDFPATDLADDLLAQVSEAVSAATPLDIIGNNSKPFLSRQTSRREEGETTAKTLEVASHSGVVSYEPTELVLTARCGTPITELQKVLAASGQTMPFEPPVFTGNDTLGGVVACGLSGPARPYTGSARDFVLGMHVINGKAEKLRFGGEVMKNVAGYDVSRLQTGAHGTLGVILDVSMKVLPLPESVATMVLDLAPSDPNPLIKLARQPLPVTATAIVSEAGIRKVYIRLSGSEAGVKHASKLIGGDRLEDDAAFWQSLSSHQHEYFQARGDQGLELSTWRLSVPDYTADIAIDGDDSARWLLEWGGAQRWLRTSAKPHSIFAAAAAVGGYATCYSELPEFESPFQPLQGTMLQLHRQVKLAFDPDSLFNRHRYHPVMMS